MRSGMLCASKKLPHFVWVRHTLSLAACTWDRPGSLPVVADQESIAERGVPSCTPVPPPRQSGCRRASAGKVVLQRSPRHGDMCATGSWQQGCVQGVCARRATTRHVTRPAKRLATRLVTSGHVSHWLLPGSLPAKSGRTTGLPWGFPLRRRRKRRIRGSAGAKRAGRWAVETAPVRHSGTKGDRTWDVESTWVELGSSMGDREFELRCQRGPLSARGRGAVLMGLGSNPPDASPRAGPGS